LNNYAIVDKNFHFTESVVNGPYVAVEPLVFKRGYITLSIFWVYIFHSTDSLLNWVFCNDASSCPWIYI